MAKKRKTVRKTTARKSTTRKSTAKKKPWVKGRSRRKSSFDSLPANAKRAAFANMNRSGELFKKSKRTGKRSRALGRKK